MVHFARHTASRAILLTLLSALATVVVAAQDDAEKTFDCKFTVGDVKYDISELAGELEANRESVLPPSTIQDRLTLNLCGALTRKDDVPAEEQCPAGTRACLVRSSKREGKDAHIVSVISLANSSLDSVKWTPKSSPKGVDLVFTGAPYPPNVGAEPVTQRLHVNLVCDADKRGQGALTFTSYDGTDLFLDWRASVACPFGEGPPNDDTPNPDKGGSKEEESVGSGLGYFFLLFFLAFVTYFALGAYYNYSTYGASGADLIPHRDFWREVPYMLRDLVAHICSAVRPRQQAARGGYIAV